MFNTITSADIGKAIDILVRVEDIRQTSGPTLFTLFDGETNFSAKAFLKPGQRAFPDVEKGDVVLAVLRIQEYDGTLEGSIVAMESRDAAAFEKVVTEMQAKKAAVESIPFLVRSEALEKMRARFEEAAALIKQAIYEDRPILVRHNADCDGYSGAMALERAIMPLVVAHHGGDNYAQWRFYRRAPSRAPYYSMNDVLLDLSSIANDLAKGGKAPLVIILDNGSGEEDVVSIRAVQAYGCQVIIVDHHFLEKDLAQVDVHINPYLVGHDSQISAGMLGVELARFVNIKASGVAYMAALAGVGDKTQSAEMDQYRKIAEREGFTLEFLKQLAVSIDFVAYYLRSVEARGLIDDLFGRDAGRQKALVSLLYGSASRKIQEILVPVKHYTHVIEHGGKNIAVIDLAKICSFGDFPPMGKVTGAASDWLNTTYSHVYVLGVADDMIVLRVSATEVGFNLNKLISALREKMPFASVSGGGHERAGTIKFVAAAKDEVVEFVKRYILDG
jgi:RecJ-like exonuclease